MSQASSAFKFFIGLAIIDFYISAQLTEKLRTMQASSEEGVVEALTGILRRTPHTELENAFHRWVRPCDWVIIHSDE
jgi:hypothetical protein